MTSRILLVEDDPVSRDLIAALVASHGHEVDTAGDGFGALRMAQETRYDLIFVDYHLPEMDGYALARLMRSIGETANRDLKMVAITADRFGLAARRGVDTIFDRVLPKPIEPDALFAFLDECLGGATGDIEAFLAAPGLPIDAPSDAREAGHMLWRARGLAAPPKVAAVPAPSPAERESLEQCFRLVEPDEAEALLLLRRSGLPALEALRAGSKACLQPLVVLDPGLAPLADAHFEVGDGDSWSRVAQVLKDFAARRAMLAPEIVESADADTHFIAYLHLAGRPLDLLRDAEGRTIVPYTAGFSATGLIESVKRLAGRGLVAAKLDPASAPERRLVVSLTAKGTIFVAGGTRRAV